MIELSLDTHMHLGSRKAAGFGFSPRMASVLLAAVEISRVAQALPVLFRKRDNCWQALAVLVPVEGVNLQVTQGGKWWASFVPAFLRACPFCLTSSNNLGTWQGFVPEALVTQDVQPLFVDGDLTPVLKQTEFSLNKVKKDAAAINDTLDQLDAAGALTPWAMPWVDAGLSEQRVRDLCSVDVKILETLTDSLMLNFYRSGALRWKQSHLDSLHHAARFESLARSIVHSKIALEPLPKMNENSAEFLSVFAVDLGDTDI